jgi:glucose/arabinose dehydrogenase
MTRPLCLALLVAGCADDEGVGDPLPDATVAQDTGPRDAGEADADSADAGPLDAGRPALPRLNFERVELELDETTTAGHQHVTTFAFIPGTNDLLLSELHGDVYHYRIADGVGTLLGHFTLAEHVYPQAPDFEGDCGLISLAFDPSFEDNGFLYVGACLDPSSSGILRLSFDPGEYDAIATSAVIIMRESREGSLPIHNVGQLGFDLDGYLWALYGDRDNPEAARDRHNNLGSLVRIEPSRALDGEGYVPAPGNPYIGNPDGWSEAIYAYGFRSPWTGHIDALGRWWVGDVGTAPPGAVEEINVVTAPGDFFGWPAVEGPCEGECEGLVDPVRHWDHGSDHPFVAEMVSPYPSPSRVAWVGVEYRGRGNDPYDGALTGRMLYGEMCVGFVRAMELDAMGEVLTDGPVGELPKISAWDQGADGYLYASTYGACEASRSVVDIPAGLWRAVLDDDASPFTPR